MSIKVQAIIAAGGVGQRLGMDKPKPLIFIKDKPLFLHTLEGFEKSTLIDSIILVVHPEHKNEYQQIIENSDLKKKILVVDGGERRVDSVANGLEASDDDTEVIVVHDSARPFVTVDMIDQAITISIDEELAAKIREETRLQNFRNKSHLVETAILKFLE